MAKALTPIESFLAPLARLALKDPDIEGHVFWSHDGNWTDMDADPLDSEEICFYAEGLLLEGFHMRWEVLGSPETGPEGIRMLFWQGSATLPPPDPETLSTGLWPIPAR